jgi:pyruvate dehydrogenase E2 component (dihydrolipoamide acetyltransferase)
MANLVSMPKLGFDMAEGTLVRWVVQEGQPITKGGVLAEIETDKATVEVESTHEGTVLRHLVKEGAIVPVNTPIAVIGAAGESVDLAALGVTGGEAEPPAGEKVASEAAVAVKAEATPAAGAAKVAEGAEEPGLPEGVRASPLARRMALERGIDLRQVKGSGPLGRIVKVDIEGFRLEAQAATAAAPQAAAQALPPAVPGITFEPRQDRRIPLSRLRAAIGRRMVEAKQQAPHFYVTHEYDMAALMALRKQVNSMLPEAEKLSVNDFIVKGTALALRAFPNLNASVDLQKNEVVQHGAVNIGVAVAVENGLLTVVCRDADLKSLRQISLEVKTMAGRARDGKVRPEDIEGSTLSVSNLGMFEVEDFIAILNPPEAAILAIGSVLEKPVVQDGVIKPGLRMKATISVDHRVSDGAEAARFMQALAQYLEEPLRLML